jgi:hypothetical protein
MDPNEFDIKDKYTEENWRNISWNGEKIKIDRVALTKFHIQNINYSDEIAKLTDEFFENTYEEYNGQLPIVGRKYYTDIVKTPIFNQYRILISSSNHLYYLTYLLEKNNILYKPKKYEEPGLNYWIDVIYSWKSSDILTHQMTPYVEEYHDLALIRTIKLKSQTENDKIISLLTPEHKSFTEVIGRPLLTEGCSCCAGSRLDHIPPNTFIHSTGTEFSYESKKDNFRISVENYDYTNNLTISKSIADNHNSGYNKHLQKFEKFMGDHYENSIRFDFGKKNITIKTGSFFTSLFCGMLSEEPTITIGRGKYFTEESNPYSEETIYYPNWVEDSTLWIYKRSKHRFLNDFTNAIDVSDNKIVQRLFELYDYLKNELTTKLSNSREEFTSSLIKYHQITPLGDLYDQFDNFVNSQEFQTLKQEMLQMLDTVSYGDIVKSFEVRQDVKEYYDFYKVNPNIKTSPHVFLTEELNYKFPKYCLFVLINGTVVSYYCKNDMKQLVHIYEQTWADKKLVLVADGSKEKFFTDDLQKSRNLFPEQGHFDSLEEMSKNNLVQKMVTLAIKTSSFSVKKKEIFDNMVEQIKSTLE